MRRYDFMVMQKENCNMLITRKKFYFEIPVENAGFIRTYIKSYRY